MPTFSEQRARMVERQLARRGIGDARVLAAMAEVPREHFVERRLRRRAYADGALPIGEDQTISQPWVVAAICEALELDGSESVLEVGTGSGYSSAILSRLASRVISVERHAGLVEEAAERLAELGIDNVELCGGDGSLGIPESAPFDAIAVHASAPEVPRALIAQLAEGGRLVVPVAREGVDQLTAFTLSGSLLAARVIAPCRFVPLIGAGGYREDERGKLSR